MFEQKRLSGDGAHATWAEQLGERDEQVDGEDEEFAHRANGTMIAVPRKTAQADSLILGIRHPQVLAAL
jgi:hypothetical protein